MSLLVTGNLGDFIHVFYLSILDGLFIHLFIERLDPDIGESYLSRLDPEFI